MALRGDFFTCPASLIGRTMTEKGCRNLSRAAAVRDSLLARPTGSGFPEGME
jgi:hypothetical protein